MYGEIERPEEVREVEADDDDLEDVAGVAVFLVTDLKIRICFQNTGDPRYSRTAYLRFRLFTLAKKGTKL